MVFNDTTDKLGICQEIDALCDSDTTSYPLADKARRANSAIETLTAKIMQVCKNFPYDDENIGDLAEGTITLEEGVSKYTLTDKFLNVLGWKVKDTSGYWHIVQPYSMDEANRDGIVLETKEAETGLPLTYRAVGRTFFFAPAPGAAYVTLAAGGKFFYSRTAHLFTADDTDAVPGIASPWHITIVKMAALPFCKTYKKDRVAQLVYDIAEETKEMVFFYANRQKDRVNRFIPKIENCH